MTGAKREAIILRTYKSLLAIPGEYRDRAKAEREEAKLLRGKAEVLEINAKFMEGKADRWEVNNEASGVADKLKSARVAVNL